MQTAVRKTEYQPRRKAASSSSAARGGAYSCPAQPKRNVKMEGNVAYINTEAPRKPKPKQKGKGNNEFLAEEIKREAKKARAAAKPKNAVKPKSASAVVTKAKPKSARGVVSTILVIFAAFCALAFLVSRYAALCAIGTENNRLEKDISGIEAQIDKLKVDMEMKGDLMQVQNTAENVLGMTYPGEDQKVTMGSGD